MLIKIYLSLVGILYMALAVWCSLSPASTSEKVGFQLKPGGGQSEFLVIYGGLELGMALVFLLPWIRQDFLMGSLWACILIHSSLVVFRTISLLLYQGIPRLTYQLAIGEWIILILALACLMAKPTES